MRMLSGVSCLVLGLLIVANGGASSAADGGDPKYSIKDVMVKAHKGPLLKKVTGGKSTEAENKELLEMYQSMAKAKMPKGDEKSWKTKTDDLVAAAKLVVDGKNDDGIAKLNKASNCAGCHKLHKG